ncbi:MAG: hypothetical protein D6719_04650 [Candidatus Dadabacteria bacterium]|nr:MAG: hypothetical protein D6719_04650 [Candidatus Dadabacteria bacterium]
MSFALQLKLSMIPELKSFKDKANKFKIPRGSALECGTIIDSLAILKITDSQKHKGAKILLVRIEQMLWPK